MISSSILNLFNLINFQMLYDMFSYGVFISASFLMTYVLFIGCIELPHQAAAFMLAELTPEENSNELPNTIPKVEEIEIENELGITMSRLKK